MQSVKSYAKIEMILLQLVCKLAQISLGSMTNPKKVTAQLNTEEQAIFAGIVSRLQVSEAEAIRILIKVCAEIDYNRGFRLQSSQPVQYQQRRRD